MKRRLHQSIRTPLACSLITIALTACGGGGGGSNSVAVSSTPLTGLFLDSAVQNLSYNTDTLSGITNEKGEYQYVEGESVTFYIGNLAIGPVLAQPVITPLTLAGTTDLSNQTAINIARLLQSLDSNGDLNDGIQISDAAKSFAPASIDFTVDTATFESNPDVTSFITNSGGTLVSEADAIAHLSSTIAVLTAQATWDVTSWDEAAWQ